MGSVPLADAVAALAAASPRSTAVRVDRGDRLTFGGLEQRTNRLARAVVAAGGVPGGRVRGRGGEHHPPDLLAAYVAAHKAGATVCVLPLDAGRAELARLLRTVGPRLVLACDEGTAA